MSKDVEDEKLNRENDETNEKEHPNLEDTGSARIFEVNIDEGGFNKGSVASGDSHSERPSYNGEVYFANHKKNAASILNNDASGANAPIPPPLNNQNGGKGEKAKKTNANKKPFPKAILVTVISLILVATTLLSTLAISCFNDVLPTTNRSDTQVLVKIPNEASTAQIIDILDENNLVNQKLFCNIFMSAMKKLKKGKKDPVYLGGSYYLSQSMGIERMLNELKEEQTAAETIKLVFPEGWTIYQIFEKLEKYEVCKADYLYTAINDILGSYDFTKNLGGIDGRYLALEGYFFPDTYEFYVGENANSVIKRFLDNFQEKWTDEYVARASKLGLSIDQVLTIASVIQKEAANKEQMAVISSVIHNRLNDNANYPTIDCDSTHEYISKFVEPVTGKTKAAALMNTYNTYSCVGLPAGPICSPGDDAIKAALYPEKTDYTFFQHDNKGKIYMAKNADQHRKNSLEVAKANSNLAPR